MLLFSKMPVNYKCTEIMQGNYLWLSFTYNYKKTLTKSQGFVKFSLLDGARSQVLES